MKWKQIVAGILTSVMVVANIPSFGVDGIGLQQVQAEEAAAPVYRYQSIQGMKAYAGWATRYDAPIENLLTDDTSVTYSRYNTGYIPRSTYISERNNIFIKLNTASSISKLSYYPNETERSGGDGTNVHNGTITRVNVYVSKAAIGDTPAADDANWELALENVRLDSDTELTAQDSKIPRHDIAFENEIEGVLGIRIQVLNSAGVYEGTSSAADKDKRDMFISGRELEVYSGANKVANADMTFTSDFACHSGNEITKLNDGDLGDNAIMHSAWETDDNYSTAGPHKVNEGHYFANNNMYFTLPESTLVGKLTYVAGALNGNIKRARIYVSNEELGQNETPADIHDSAWLKVYDNSQDTDPAWTSYTLHGSLAANSTDVPFDSVHMARHVRVEVLETQYSDDAIPNNKVTNKWISGRRVYIYAAEPLNQVEAETNVALGTEAGGQAQVAAYTGVAQGREITNLNDNAGDDSQDNNDYWLPKYDIRGNGTDAGKANYVVLDLGTTETDISKIMVRWHNKAFATEYKIETSDTCRVSGDVTDADNDAADGSEDVWTEVVNYTRENTDVTFPKDEFSGDALSQKKLKRYVRLYMPKTNGGAALWTAVREFQIIGTRLQAESVKNVALGEEVDGITTTVKAYTGENTQDGFVTGNAIDGNGIDTTDNTGTYWTSTRPMKSGGSVDTPGSRDGYENAVSYIILDLGENTATQLESVRIRWQNMIFGSEYEIQTSDVCDADGNVGNDVTTATIAAEEHADAWETVARVSKNITSKPGSNPLDEFGEGKGNPLEKTYLKRYVRILVTKMNLYAAASEIGIKEIEINGIRRNVTTSEVDLNWVFENFAYGDGEMATAMETTPRYGNIFRSPSTNQGAGYHVVNGSTKWEYRENETDEWQTETKDYFDFGKYYRGSVEIASLGAPFSELVDVKVNNSTDGVTASVKDGKLVVSKTYAPLTNYTEQYTALKTWFTGDDSKAIRDRYTEGQGESTDNSWNRFVTAYKYVSDYLAKELSGEDGDRTAPGGFRPNSFADGKDALIAAYQRLNSNQEELELDHPVMITVEAPAEGKAPSDARLTRGGSVKTEPADLVPVKGDLEYSIGSENELKGNIKFPNGEGGNDVFNIKGTNQFLMNFELYVPERLDHAESIIGKLNQQYVLQIDGSNLYLSGKLVGGWHQVNCSVASDDWYGVWHDVVAIYNGDKFQMYVDGVASVEAPGYGTRHGALLEYPNSIFCIGYNPDSGHSGEGFSGGIRNIRMFIQDQEDTNDDFPDWEAAIESKTDANEIMAAFDSLLENAAPELKISGTPASYEVVSTRWTPADAVFEKYKDYKVEVDVRTIPGVSADYVFPADAAAEVTGLTAEEQAKVKYSLNDNADTMTISYTFPRAKHPVEVLNEYLDGLAAELEVANAAENKNASNVRVYTNASWEAYLPKYQAAMARKNDALTTATETACQTAYDELVAAVGALDKAADTCECTIESVTLEGGDISLAGASVQKSLEAAYTVNFAGCMKHSASPQATVEYAIADGSTAGIASISGSTLTVTGEGTVKVTATATLKDGNREVDAKTTETPASYTVTSPKTSDVADLQSAVDSIASSYDQSEYTEDSWQNLQDAVDAAKELLDTVKGGGEISVNARDKALDAINAAIEALVKKGGGTADSVQDLRDLVNQIEDEVNQADYTVESWNALVEIYNQAVEELNSGNPDAEKCADLLSKLTNAKNSLVTKAADLQNAKNEVNSAVAAADAVYSAGQKDYPADLWKAFSDAYNAAKNAPANADAATLRRLANALAAAQAALKPAPAVPDAGLTNGYTQTAGAFEYKVINAEKKTVMVVKGTNKKAKTVKIPATVTLKNVKCNVVQIGTSAFKGYKKLNKVTISKNVTTIGKNAFSGCSKLKTVIVQGKALKSINKNAFKNTAKKATVKWQKAMKAKQRKKLAAAMRKQGLKIKK